MTITIPMRTVSEANQHRHWRKRQRRAKSQRHTAWVHTLKLLGGTGKALPLVVTLTRIAPRKLDDDNLRGALKAVRDGVADALGVDDGDDRVTWLYSQRKGAVRENAVVIEIEREAG